MGTEPDQPPPHLILIDGSGFIFRAYHALPPMTRPDGTPVNAVFGFSNMLSRLLKDHVGTHFAVIFDAGHLTFRNRLYDQYKAQRPEPPEDLRPQFALVRDATRAFGVPSIELEDWEADDLIASYATAAVAAGGRATIVSSDKDLMQLLRPGIDMLDPMKQKPIGLSDVMEKFGVPPEKLIDAQALIGDSVDNVPGVPGIGPKTAALLIQEHGDLEAILAAAPAMKPSKRRDLLIEHAEQARLSRILVTLRCDAPLPEPLEALVAREPDREILSAWLAAQGFRSLITRLGLDSGASAAAPAAPPPPTRAGAQGGLFPDPPTQTAIADSNGFGGYETVTTLEALHAWIAAARAAGTVAVDTETDNLDAMRANLVGISLATAPGRACYIPLRHDNAAEQLAPQAALAALAELFADETVLKIFQNAKYDLTVFAQAGATAPAPIDDTMLISFAMDAGAHGHGMDELSRLHLGHTPISYDSVTGTGKGRLSFAQVPLDRATAYAAEDADITWRLWHALRPRLRAAKALALYEQVERRLIPVLLEMERAGIKVDADELRALSKDFARRMAVMEIDIHKLAGEPFNLGSPKQLGEILFDKMKLPGGKRMKTGAWGTDAGVLQGLADQGHDLPNRILEWRQLAKLKSTYTDALVEQINPDTHRVHTSYAMAVASTGRLSSTDPNLQNIPVRTEEGGRIRRSFVAEPGHLLVSADYSQIELRLLAHVADIPQLKESFARGEDIHARTASEVFGVPMAGMDGATRRRAKAINFGIIYGISAFGLARQLQIEPGEAKAYIDLYFRRYPAIRDYMEAVKEEARQHGYVLTPFGRRCWIPGIADKNPARRGYAERQAINAPLQGGAADIIKRAMVKLPAALADSNLGARMLLQVHDELLFEVPDSAAKPLAELARGVMQSAATLSVPLVVETGIGGNWAEAH
ncbi:MAG: DNA polymerase I [Acetobacteraceae bacterium]|nr:DNA polymerase I [Acetobacteraceae bacterium]